MIILTNLCVVTFPIIGSGTTPLSNLLKILSNLADSVYVISGGEGTKGLSLNSNVGKIRINHKPSVQPFLRIFNFIFTQLRILLHIIRKSKEVDLFIFFIGGQALLLPLLVSFPDILQMVYQYFCMN